MGSDDAHDRSAWFAANRKSAREHVNMVTALVPKSKFPFVRLAAAPDALVQLVRAAPVVGMEQSLPCANVRLDVLLVISEHLFPTRRVDDGAGLQIPIPHPLACSGEGKREALLAFTQRRVDLL